MMDQLLEESMLAAEKAFQEKDFYLSYSSLNKLLWSPAAFYQIYVMGIREEKTSSFLLNGKLIHALLLDPESINKNYITSPTSLPGDSIKNVVDRVFSHHLELVKHGDTRTQLEEYANAIIDILKDINLHQSLKTDDQRVAKVITSDALNYWSFLMEKEGKEIIDMATLNYCIQAADIIKNDPEMSKLMALAPTDFDNVEVYNEQEFSYDMENHAFKGIKGIIDNLVIDHERKVIFINDLKTTSKELKDFRESIDYYSYWMQAAMYSAIVYGNFIKDKYPDYNMQFHFIVIDKNLQAYAFPVSQYTSNAWLMKLDDSFKIADYHLSNNKFNLPYDFCTKKVVL